MRSGEGVEEKEWFVIFGIDEINRFLTEHIGQVIIEFDPFPILFNRLCIACLIIFLGIVKITP
jgi:hypothetical protein